MKKIISLLLSVILIISSEPLLVVANSDVPSADVSATLELLDALGIDVVSESSEHLTRAEFVYIIAQAIGYTPAVSSVSSSEDIPADSYYAGAVKYALDSKILSPASSFNPNSHVKFIEACKITVSALGLDYYAIAQGGYPIGYTIAADRYDLLTGVESAEYLSYTGVFKLINNFLHANVHIPSSYKVVDGDGMTAFTEGDPVLKFYHDIEMLEDAFITATAFTGLYEADGACGLNEIEIDNKIYKYSGSSGDLIGKRANVYYKAETSPKEVLYIDTTASKTITVSTEYIYRAANQNVSYLDGKNDEDLMLIPSPSYIYNNCADSNFKISELLSVDGTVTFIDNDENGTYDVVYVKECEVSIVADVDIYSNSIVCEDNTIIDLSKYDGQFSLEKDGKSCNISDIAAGDVLQIFRSRDDAKLITVVVSQAENVTGTVTEIDKSNKTIYIDNKAYIYNQSFEDNDLVYCTLNSVVTLALTDLGVVGACFDYENEAKYGYYLAMKKEKGLSNSIQMKLLDDSGMIDVYTLADRVKLNGKIITKSEVCDEISGAEEKVIRYIATTDKVINMIVTQTTEGVLKGDKPLEDRLTLFKFPSSHLYTTIWYIPETKMIHPYFKIGAKTKVFIIVSDNRLEDSQRYRVSTSSYFDSNRSISPEKITAYDVAETGEAGVVVIKSNDGSEKVSSTANYGLIYSVHRAINPDGFPAVAVVLYCFGQYKRYCIDSESVLTSIKPGSSFDNIPLKNGDYIRYNLDARGYISAIAKDYDNTEKKVTLDFVNHLDDNAYYYGTVYDRDGAMISIIPENVSNITEGLTNASHRYRFTLSTSITVFENKSGSIYSGTVSEIITYLQSPTDCQKLLIKMYEGNIKDVVLYK